MSTEYCRPWEWKAYQAFLEWDRPCLQRSVEFLSMPHDQRRSNR